MPSKAAHPRGVLAKVRSLLRGDRYMIDAWPVDRVPGPAPAPVAVATPPPEKS
jgi:hypothetical protein